VRSLECLHFRPPSNTLRWHSLFRAINSVQAPHFQKPVPENLKRMKNRLRITGGFIFDARLERPADQAGRNG
jgi:hypothetical protein